MRLQTLDGSSSSPRFSSVSSRPVLRPPGGQEHRPNSSPPAGPCPGGWRDCPWSRRPSRSDTPNLVTDIVRRNGVAGNWVWWAFTLTGVATVFFYARLWRRSGVLTDLEFYELRYSGKAAGVVRGFRSVYLGLFFNCIIMATVNLAACKIAALLFGLTGWRRWCSSACSMLSSPRFSGLWGVLVIDMIQFVIDDDGRHRRGLLRRPQHVGGLRPGRPSVSAMTGPGGIELPEHAARLQEQLGHRPGRLHHAASPSSGGRSGIPGAEPGGGSYIAQRMLASKSEKDSLGARPLLQPGPLRPPALALDPGRPVLADRFSRARPTSRRPSPTSTPACSGTTSPIRPCSSSCRSVSSG